MAVIFSAYIASTVIFRSFGERSGEFVVFSIYAAGVAHAIVMIAAFAWPAFGSVLYSIIPLGTAGERFVSDTIRSPGLTSGGGDALSAVQGLILVFGLYYLLLMKRRVGILALILHGGAFSLLILSLILSARAGFVVVTIGIFAIAGKYIYKSAKSGGLNTSPILRILSLLTLASPAIWFIYFNIEFYEYSRIITRSIEPFTNYIQHGDLSTRSTDVLIDEMIFFPESTTHILFGDGNFGRNANLPYIRSDSGYIRIIHGSGVIGIAAILFTYIFIIASSVSLRKYDRHVAFLTALTAVMILIMNIKVLHIGGYRETFIVMSLLFAVLCTRAVRSRKTGSERTQLQTSEHPVGGAV